MIKFLVFGDLHFDDCKDGYNRINELIEKAKSENVDFVVSLGDLCYPVEQNKPVLDKINSVGVPVYHSIGNHDTQVTEIDEILKFLGLPRSFYSFVYEDYKFIVLNSCYCNKDGVDYPFQNAKREGAIYPVISAEETKWLKGELEDDKKHIIFSHHSLVNDFGRRGVQNRDKLHKLFAGKNIILCMNGHDHGDDLKVVNDIPFYTVNSSFGVWLGIQIDSAECLKEKYGYLNGYLPYKEALHVVIELDGDEIRIKGIDGQYQSVTVDDIELYDHHWNGVAVEPRTSSYTLKCVDKVYAIRVVNEKDIPQCVNVIRKSFSTVADEFGFTIHNAPRFTAFATTEERLMWHLKGEHRPMYAFYDNGSIVGYYSLLLQENEECELNNLCVLPTYRHKRIGEQLLINAFENARNLGCKKMNIGIVEENKVLKKWYQKFGFVHTGTQKFDFFPFTCGYMEKWL